MARFIGIALVGALMAGCAAGPYTNVVKGTIEQLDVTLGVGASVGAGRTIQAVVAAYTAADVDHLAVDLYKDVDGSFTLISSQQTPAGSGVTKTVDFTHLKMNTTYKVAVSCITAGGASINKNDGSGEATVTTSNDDYVPLTVNVNLADKVFDGTLHPVVNVTDGTVLDPGQAEAGSVVDNL